MKRKLFGLASALSLLVLLATAVLWMRSYWDYDSIESPIWSGRNYGAASERGEMQFSVTRPLTATPDSGWMVRTSTLAAGMGSPWGPGPTYGIRSGHMTWVFAGAGPVADERFIVVSDWLIIELTAILPVLWICKAVRARHRLRNGYCARCGYDLRASAERCPECGAAISTSTTQSEESPR